MCRRCKLQSQAKLIHSVFIVSTHKLLYYCNFSILDMALAVLIGIYDRPPVVIGKSGG